MPETVNSEYRQTESLRDCLPSKLHMLGKASGISHDPDVVRLTLTITLYLECQVQGNDNSCKRNTYCPIEHRCCIWLKNVLR